MRYQLVCLLCLHGMVFAQEPKGTDPLKATSSPKEADPLKATSAAPWEDPLNLKGKPFDKARSQFTVQKQRRSPIPP